MTIFQEKHLVIASNQISLNQTILVPLKNFALAIAYKDRQ